MFENNTDRMFWTIAVLILGATLLMISNRAFPKAQESIMSTLSQNIQTSNDSTNKLNDSQTDSKIAKKSDFDKIKNYDYDYNADGTINLIKYKGSSRNIEIPKWGPTKKSSNIEDAVKITTINRDDNYNKSTFESKNINNVNIPNSITYIGRNSFYDNDLTFVHLPTSVKNIGRSAFNSNKLKSIDVPNSLSNIGHSVFANNELTNVQIPNSIVSIGFNSFYNNKIKNINIPASVTKLDNTAFNLNSNIAIHYTD